MKSYYNTNQLEGDALKKAVANAKMQEEAVLLIYQNTRKAFSPSQIMALTAKAGKNYPITSIRRCLTNLCTSGHLVKTDDMVKGMYGSPEHKWKLDPAKYPTQIAEQTKLFNNEQRA